MSSILCFTTEPDTLLVDSAISGFNTDDLIGDFNSLASSIPKMMAAIFAEHKVIVRDGLQYHFVFFSLPFFVSFLFFSRIKKNLKRKGYVGTINKISKSKALEVVCEECL